MKVQRYLPPTAAPLGVLDLIRGAVGLLHGDHVRQQLEADIKSYFGSSHVFLVSSGKAALSTILRALKSNSSRTTVIIPAYTCFSLPSAVLKAGLNLALCDVNPRSLDFDLSQLQDTIGPDTLAVVVPHLLGKPADIQRIQAMAHAKGAVVVEDAAQAMGGKDGGRWLGTQTEVGFFSFGRGKNVSAGSGGMILTNSDAIGAAVQQAYSVLPTESPTAAVKNFLSVVATKWLLHPNLYWVPAGLPFLGLGETIFYPDFPAYRMDGIRMALLLSWRTRLERSNKNRAEVARRMITQLPLSSRTAGVSESAPWLRFPVLMPTSEDKRALCQVARQKGLGISGLYPSPISEIPELRRRFAQDRYPGAKILAERLVTLPIHCYVSDRDIERI
jgi:perosamine synthetase